MKIIVILITAFLSFRTLYPAITYAESGNYRKALGYLAEFACIVFILHNFSGLV